MRHHSRQPRDKVIGAAAKHIAVIINGIVMIEGADQRIIAPVDASAITHHQIGERHPVEEFAIVHRCAAFRPACRPKKVQSARLMPEL